MDWDKTVYILNMKKRLAYSAIQTWIWVWTTVKPRLEVDPWHTLIE